MGQVVSFTPRPLYCRRRIIQYPLNMRPCVCFGEENNVLILPGLSFVRPQLSHYTNWATAAFRRNINIGRSIHHTLRSNREFDDKVSYFLTSETLPLFKFHCWRTFHSSRAIKIRPPSQPTYVCVCVNAPPQDSGPRGTGESSALVSAVCDWCWGDCNTAPVHRGLRHF
jgi:hypothetical protein